MLDLVEDRVRREAPRDLGFGEDDLQQRLAAFNRRRLVPGLPSPHWRDEIEEDRDWLILEGEFLERERNCVAPRAAEAPTDPDGFDAWLTDLTATGPGQGDPGCSPGPSL